jgi:hypothetical protein
MYPTASPVDVPYRNPALINPTASPQGYPPRGGAGWVARVAWFSWVPYVRGAEFRGLVGWGAYIGPSARVSTRV